MRFNRLAAVAGVSALVIGLAACSATGGKPRGGNGSGSGGGTVDTPAFHRRDDHPRGTR